MMKLEKYYSKPYLFKENLAKKIVENVRNEFGQ
jgi:hypothetical protein